MKDKNYLVEVATESGDRETTTKFIVSAPCAATAGHYGIYLMAYDPANLEWEDDLEAAADSDYHYLHTLWQSEEIETGEIETLKKHMPSYKHNTTDLNKCGEYEELRFIQLDCAKEASVKKQQLVQ